VKAPKFFCQSFQTCQNFSLACFIFQRKICKKSNAMSVQKTGAKQESQSKAKKKVFCSVADPDPNPDLDPPDPRVFGPPGSGSGSFYYHVKIVRKTLIPTIL
jgi:hypothetical protein